VFLDWREAVEEAARPWSVLAERLAGGGVPSLDEAMRLLLLEPAHEAVRAALDPALVAALAASGQAERGGAAAAAAEAARRARALLVATRELSRRHPAVTGGELRGDLERAVRAFGDRLDAALRIGELEARFESPWPREARGLLAAGDPAALGSLVAWCLLEALGRLGDPASVSEAAARLFDALRLRAVLAEAVGRLGPEGEDRWRAAARLRVALAHARPAAATAAAARRPVPLGWLDDPDAAWLTGVHEYHGVRYFVKEPFTALVWWLALPALLDLAAEAPPSPRGVRALERDIAACMRAAEDAGYRAP
jgi:hypothetical protein